MEAFCEAHVGSNNDSRVVCFWRLQSERGFRWEKLFFTVQCKMEDQGGKRCSAKALGGGGGVRMGHTAGQRRRRWPSSLFGYIPFLQDDLSLPGGQLGLVIAQGP